MKMEMLMRRLASLTYTMLILAAPSLGAAAATTHSTRNTRAQNTLFITVSTLDAELFNTFNHCASPDQLQKHAGYLRRTLSFITTRSELRGPVATTLRMPRTTSVENFGVNLFPAPLKSSPLKDMAPSSRVSTVSVG
jgi:hypothetical protein